MTGRALCLRQASIARARGRSDFLPLSISMNSPTNSQAPPLRKFHHGLLLRLQPEPAKALTIGADAIVADEAMRGSGVHGRSRAGCGSDVICTDPNRCRQELSGDRNNSA